MNIYSIYKATNKINGKVYIGFDSNWPNRFYTHKNRSNYNKEQSKSKFYNSIRKHGWDNFDWEIIYQSNDGEHCKNIMENYFINEYRSYVGFGDCNGYNTTLGGDGSLGVKVLESTRNKLSKSNTGQVVTEETRRKIGLKNKGRKLSKKDYSFVCVCCGVNFIDSKYSSKRKYCSIKCSAVQRELNKKLNNFITNQEELGQPFTKNLNHGI
jgi:group I intron endonuclease